MSSSALILGLSGLALSFLPQEALGFFELETKSISVLLLQILGAMYFAFGMLNWMARSTLIGGIYNRPIAIGNTIHFTMVALALVKLLISSTELSNKLWVLALVYILFAVLFGRILFKTPKI